MNGDIWRTPSGETGPEVDRQSINGEVVVKVLVPAQAHLPDWHARVEYVPEADLVAVPNDATRYGGDRGGRAI